MKKNITRPEAILSDATPFGGLSTVNGEWKK
jgi:hypothetical protein